MTSRKTPGRKAPAPRVPTNAQQAVDRLLDKIRTKADQTPPATKEETRGEEQRDADGHFAKGARPGPGRPPGSPNKIPKSIKEIVRALGEGVIDVTFKDPATDKLVEGPVAHLFVGQLVAGLNDPKHYAAFVKMLLEYDLRQPATQTEVGPEHRRQTPKMVFLHETRKVVVPAPPKSVPGDNGLGEGEDRLELAEDPPIAMLGLQRVRPAAHRIWSPHRAVRRVRRLRPTSMTDDVSPCGPVCPSGPRRFLAPVWG